MKKKRYISVFLAFSLFVLLFPFTTVHATSIDDVTSKMDTYVSFLNSYGNAYWNGNLRSTRAEKDLKNAIDRGDFSYGLTSHQCVYSGTHKHANGCTSNVFGGAAQCHGFGKYFAYYLFGNYPTSASGDGVAIGYQLDTAWIYYQKCIGYSECPALQPGDFIRYFPSESKQHTAIVYSINGDTITVIQGNGGDIGKCGITKYPLSISYSTFKNYFSKNKAYVCRSSSIGTVEKIMTVTTDGVTELTETSARLNGHFQSNYTAHITEHGAYFGTNPDNMVKVAVDKVNYNKSKLTMFYRTGKYYGDLTPGTTYYYRQYVVADDKEFKGDIVSFTTPGQSVPPDETEKPSRPIPEAPSITVSSDTIYVGQSATIRWNSVADTLVYSLIISGTKVISDQFDGSNTSYVLSNLPEGTYTIRLYASGSGGTSPESNTVTLKVIPKPSAHHVYTAPATNITATSAQLNGSFSSDTKPHMTEHGAYMGTNPNAMTKVAVDKVDYYKSSLTMFYSTSKYYGSLSPDTTYYFCEYAVLDGVEVRGETLSFTTPKQQSSSIRNGVIRGTVGNLSIRSGPGTSYTKLGRIPEGATCSVDLSRTSGNWYWVTYNGISGYASKNYIVLQ